ncbi:MAG: hypothetical protein WA655_12045 [Candidatus Korobacteraceae bacterium]
MKREVTLFGVLAALIFASVAVAAQTTHQIYVGTTNNVVNWQVKANGSHWVNPAHVVNLKDPNGPVSYDDWAIGVSTDGGPNTVVPGLPLTPGDGWNGVWFGRTSFYLPPSANYAILIVRPFVRHESDSLGRFWFAADDRVILGLNKIFGDGNNPPTVGWTLCSPGDPGCGNRLGVQNIAETGKHNYPYIYADQIETYITDQKAFRFGQTNWVYLTVNNTGSYNAGDDSSPWHTDTDLTFVGVDVYVIYGDYSQFPHPAVGM